MSAVAFTLPKIGIDIPALGGIFAGIVASADGGEDVAVIIGPELGRAGSWSAQQKKAKASRHGGFSDWDCGTRPEHSVAFANLKHLFERDWYWTREQHAGTSDYAWCQGFGNGNQNGFDEDSKLRARLFRRLPISQFIHCTDGLVAAPEGQQ